MTNNNLDNMITKISLSKLTLKIEIQTCTTNGSSVSDLAGLSSAGRGHVSIFSYSNYVKLN